MNQPYTKQDLERGADVVKELHGLKGYDAWAECIAKAISAERDRSSAQVETAGKWRPMDTAPKDRSSVLLLLKNPLLVDRPDLEYWPGLQFVGRHPGVCEDGFDI